MSLRSLSLVALLAFATPTLAGERLLVAGSDGAVYQADPSKGHFEYFACACLGPATALAAYRQDLYVADELGQLLIVDAKSGAMKSLVSLSTGPVSAMVATPGGLFVGTEGGLVARVDPISGETLDERATTSSVRALAARNGNLFAATADSGIYRAPIAGGDFTYFSCFCFFNLQELVTDGPDLFAGDGSGLVIRINGETGELLSAQWTLPMNAMAVSGGVFLVHGGNGVIGRVDMETGLPLGKLEAPADVRAMLVLRDRASNPIVSPKGTKPAQHP